MWLEINPRSSIPIYQQVVDGTKELIAWGLMTPGERMPTVRELAVELSTAALLCLFSLALLVATFSGGILSAVLFTAIITGLPWMLVSLCLDSRTEINSSVMGRSIDSNLLAKVPFVHDNKNVIFL